MDANDSPKAVLVVANQDEAVLPAVSSTLAKAGFTVTGVSTAAAALNRCREDHPELAVVDATVPGIDLPDLVFQLHQINPEIRVLLLFGDTASPSLSDIRARWHAKLLHKPFRRSQLLGQV